VFSERTESGMRSIFVAEGLAARSGPRILTVVDGFTREWLAIEPIPVSRAGGWRASGVNRKPARANGGDSLRQGLQVHQRALSTLGVRSAGIR